VVIVRSGSRVTALARVAVPEALSMMNSPLGKSPLEAAVKL
jgi:hypothetical protein